MRTRLKVNDIGECYWGVVSKSTSKEGIQYRMQNNHIDFNKCRCKCPMTKEEGFCNNYVSIDEMNMDGGLNYFEN